MEENYQDSSHSGDKQEDLTHIQAPGLIDNVIQHKIREWINIWDFIMGCILKMEQYHFFTKMIVV